MPHNIEIEEENRTDNFNFDKEIKLSKFKNIGKLLLDFLFKKTTVIENIQNTEENSPKDKIYNEISTKVDKYLDNDIWNFVIELNQNGYPLNKKQSEKLIDILVKNVKKDDNFIFEVIALTPEPPIEALAQSLVNWPVDYYSSSPSAKYKKVIDCIKEDNVEILVKYINKEMLEDIKNFLKDMPMEYENIGLIGIINNKKINNIAAQLKSQQTLFESIAQSLTIDFLESYKNTIHVIEKMFQEKLVAVNRKDYKEYHEKNKESMQITMFQKVYDNVNILIKNKLSHEKDDLINKTRQLYGDKLLEDKINNSINNSVISVKEELPLAAKDLLKKINSQYAVMSDMNSDDHIEIKNLYENRLPQILKKYLMIDMQYRQELKNIEGKNAEQLMIESLDNISQLFDKKVEEINQGRLSDLSVAQRYTKSINKM